jgi:hypothetical protein
MRATKLHILCLAVAPFVAACEEDQGGQAVLDGVVKATDLVLATIDDDQGTYLIEVEQGFEIDGTVQDTTGGTIQVSGWRSSADYAPGDAQYQTLSEKLFLDVTTFNAGGVVLSGDLVVTRHSVDYGTATNIEDSNRTTHYAASLTASGSQSGNFVVDVNSNATGVVQWTCGVVNEEEMGNGACY